MDKDHEIEMFVNPSRKKKKWSVFMDKIGYNVSLINKRYNDDTLHANQVLLTGEYDDATSDEELPGYNREAAEEAAVELKKDQITSLLKKSFF